MSTEEKLLLAISKAFPQKMQERYRILLQKLEDEILTSVEHKELLKLVDKMEAKNVKRLENLIALARIRNVSLNELMIQLDLNVKYDDDE